ncbi:hypothetical protein MMC07_008335 [Pseudocyphellaria aurata]|nr:hypothetical protein [Pseudocyphellaria aurata]
MAGLVSSESDHAATVSNFHIGFDPVESGDLSQQLLANAASPPSTVSPLSTVSSPSTVSPPSTVTSHDLPIRRRTASPSSFTEVDSIELAQSRSESDAISQVSSEIVGRRHVYWYSPALMTGLFIAGVFFAIGHHLYYDSLNGQEVGHLKRQQWPLRFGNVFAFLVKSCLAASAGIACVQWMWKTLRRSYITIEGIDAAFSAPENLLSLLNWEMLSKIRIGTFLALVIWCIPLAALITPATLSVRSTYQYIETSEKVASLNMSMSKPNGYRRLSQEHFAFLSRFVELRSDTGLGPSHDLARIVSASAATGNIFRIAKPLPGPNMTYQIGLHIPAIKCENSSSAIARNTTVAAVIAARIAKGDQAAGSATLEDFGALDMSLLEYRNESMDAGNLTIGYHTVLIDQGDDDRSVDIRFLLEDAIRLSPHKNQLWIVVADHDDHNGTKPLFLTCTLWNASSLLNISYQDDVQSVQRENFTYVNEVESNLGLGGPNLGQQTYTVFFRAVCKQLTGSVLAFRTPTNAYYLNNTANIKATTLAGASEFESMMHNFNLLTENDREDYSSLNKPLGALIEELSVNTSINLLSDSSLSRLTPAVVTHTQSRNEYSYEYHNLVLAYGLAIFFTLLSIILGWSAVVSNGMSYEYTVSSIIGTSQNPDLADLFRHQTPGAQPLDRQIRKTKLRFGAVAPRLSENSISAGVPGQRAAFGLEGTVSPLQKS